MNLPRSILDANHDFSECRAIHDVHTPPLRRRMVNRIDDGPELEFCRMRESCLRVRAAGPTENPRRRSALPKMGRGGISGREAVKDSDYRNRAARLTAVIDWADSFPPDNFKNVINTFP